MHWSVVRLIAGRELIDLMRDRRTLFIMLGLPLILYPVLGGVGFAFALKLFDLPSRVGIVGREHLPPPDPTPAVLTVTAGAGNPFAAVTLVVAASTTCDPPLLVNNRFPARYADSTTPAELLLLTELSPEDGKALAERRVDVIVTVPVDFAQRLKYQQPVTLQLQQREGDDVSKIAARRLTIILKNWQKSLRAARFARHGLPTEFDEPFRIAGSLDERPDLAKKGIELRGLLARVFPFLIVVWALVGALHPAIDLCAGEKERGTMETLLLSPATRREVVAGKFLAVWTCSFVSALWNLMFLGGAALLGGRFLTDQLGESFALVRWSGLAWCVVMVFPLAALFSALGLGLGAIARGTKEGQYYLIPLFLVTMPLVVLSLAPGAVLNLTTSLVPVTGQALLLQKLLNRAEPIPWWSFGPVLGSLGLYVGFALRWAARQFEREEVLFRAADGPGWRWRLNRWRLSGLLSRQQRG